MRNITKASCHPDRNMAAKGLCNACYVTKWRQDHPRPENLIRKAILRLKKLGVDFSEQEYYNMLASQDGKCAICGREPGSRHLDIDHDHKTGRVRGLLCVNCNWRVLPIYERHKHRLEEYTNLQVV